MVHFLQHGRFDQQRALAVGIQARILKRDRRFVGEGRKQANLLIVEQARLAGVQADRADRAVALNAQRHAE